MVESVGDEDKAAVAQVAAEFLQEDLPEQQFGAPKAGAGWWASILRVFDPIKASGKFMWCEKFVVTFFSIRSLGSGNGNGSVCKDFMLQGSEVKTEVGRCSAWKV